VKGWLGSVLGGGRGQDEPAVTPAAPPSPEAAHAARAQAEAHWARRLDEAECRAALAAWERALAADPADHQASLGLARGYFFLADLTCGARKQAGERAAGKQLIAAHEAGAAAAERGLRAQGVSPQDAAAIGTAQLPLGFWWAQNTIVAANAKGVAATVRQFNPVLKVMERVAQLDSGIWYGASDRYLASVFCAAPGYAGGDLQKGRKHFEASLAYAPEFFDTHVLFAQLYARPARDEPLYLKLLQHVVETAPEVLPEVVPEQTVAREKAAAELARGFRAGKR